MIGSMSAAAMLFDARDHYDNRSPRADDLIRDIKDNPDMPDALPRAISECVEAAGHEWDTPQQQALLRAARFGMDFVDVPRGDYVEMCQHLRVLCHVRNFEVRAGRVTRHPSGNLQACSSVHRAPIQHPSNINHATLGHRRCYLYCGF